MAEATTDVSAPRCTKYVYPRGGPFRGHRCTRSAFPGDELCALHVAAKKRAATVDAARKAAYQAGRERENAVRALCATLKERYGITADVHYSTFSSRPTGHVVTSPEHLIATLDGLTNRRTG